MDATVVVTGGCGFIGSHVVRALTDGGARVVAVDALRSYHNVGLQEFAQVLTYRAKHLLDRAENVQADVEDADAVDSLLHKVSPTLVIHAAGVPLATTARDRPGHAFTSILAGTFTMLEAARRLPGLQRFVYISSSMAYGNFTQPVMPETAPTQPLELYGGLKQSAEDLVRCYSRMYQLPVTIVRPTSVYGPTDLNGRVVAALLRKARAGEQAQVTNPETTRLDFTYVTDVADGIVRAALRSRGPERTYNISYGASRSLADLTAILQQQYPDASFVSRYETDFRPSRGTLDISQARDDLGYQPQVDLETGLKLYAQFLDDHAGVAATAAAGRM